MQSYEPSRPVTGIALPLRHMRTDSEAAPFAALTAQRDKGLQQVC
jgi:hypothetical protein